MPTNDTGASVIRPEPVVLTRHFAAPREAVFRAWSSAEHVRRWFAPAGYTVPDAEVDFRPGGVFAVCMRSPSGDDFWSRGQYVEVVPPERLVFEGGVEVGGTPRFSARTTVSFTEDGTGTRLTVHQAYEVFDADFLAAIAGAPEGWRSTLDKLGQEVARLQGLAVHASFTITRLFRAAPAQLFHALTDPEAKARWFSGGDRYTTLARRMDVRPGGREHLSGQWQDGSVSTFDAIYFDVVPDQRLVYTYEMHLGDRKISVSLATLELQPAGAETRLTVTEQGAFLDGYEDAGSREHGTGFLLDRLAASLAAD